MKHFVFLISIFSFAFGYSFVSPHIIRQGMCDNECFRLTDNKARKEHKDFNRTYFDKCKNLCINYDDDYKNLK